MRYTSSVLAMVITGGWCAYSQNPVPNPACLERFCAMGAMQCSVHTSAPLSLLPTTRSRPLFRNHQIRLPDSLLLCVLTQPSCLQMNSHGSCLMVHNTRSLAKDSKPARMLIFFPCPQRPARQPDLFSPSGGCGVQGQEGEVPTAARCTAEAEAYAVTA